MLLLSLDKIFGKKKKESDENVVEKKKNRKE